MKKTLSLITLLFIISASIVAQDYTIDLPSKMDSEDQYLFTKTNNNYIYLVSLEKSSGEHKVLKEYKSLDKKTKTEKVHQLKHPILFQNTFLNAFYYENNLYFLQKNITPKFREFHISSLSLKTNKVNSARFNLDIEWKKEQIISNYHKDGLLYIFTLEKKAKLFKTYTISLVDGKIITTTTEINKYDLRQINIALENNSPVSIIDYDNYNSMFSFTNNLKIYVANDEIVFSIEHTSVGTINIYKLDLSTQLTKTRTLTRPQDVVSTISSTYFDGNVYRIVASRFQLRLDITNFETKKITSFKRTDESDYPFDFQCSNTVDQDENIIKDSKRMLKTLGRRMSFIYPEIENGDTSIYLGGVLNPNRHRELIEGLVMAAGITGFFYTNGGFSPFYIRLNDAEINEKKLEYILMETNLGGNSDTNAESNFNKKVNSIILRQRKETMKFDPNISMKKIAVQKFDDKYYAVYHILDTHKLLLKEIEI